MKIQLNKPRRLLIFAFILWLIVFAVSSMIMVKKREQDMKELLSTRLLDCMEIMQFVKNTRKTFYKICDEEAMSKCRAMTYLLEWRNGRPVNQEILDGLAKSLAIMEYTVINGNGIVEYTNNPESKGYNIAASEQSREFLPALTNADFELIQRAQPRSDGKIRKYIGKARRDDKGLIQVVYGDEYVKKIQSIGRMKEQFSLMRIGADGFIVIAKQNVIVEAENPDMIGNNLTTYGINLLPQEGTFFDFNINGENFLACYERYEDLQLIGVIPKTEITDVAMICIITSVIETIIAVVFVSLMYRRIHRSRTTRPSASKRKQPGR